MTYVKKFFPLLFNSRKSKSITLSVKKRGSRKGWRSYRFYHHGFFQYRQSSVNKWESILGSHIIPHKYPSLCNINLGYRYINLMTHPVNDIKLSPPIVFFWDKSNVTYSSFDYHYVSIVCDLSRNTSAGFSYFKPTKDQNSYFSWCLFQRTISNIDSVFSVIKLAEKKELLPVEKVFKKIRLFSVCEFHTEIIFRFFFNNCYRRLVTNEHRIWKVGYSLYHQGLASMFFQMNFKDFNGLDGSAYDTSCSMYIMLCGCILMCRVANYSNNEIILCCYWLYLYLRQPRVFEDLVFSVNGCMPSGVFLTILLNCFVCLYVALNSLPSAPFLDFVTINNVSKLWKGNVQLYDIFATCGDDVYCHKSLEYRFCTFAVLFGLDYKPQSSPLFLSMEPMVIDGYFIARPKNIDTLYDVLYWLGNKSTVMYQDVFLSLLTYYYYYFKFSPDKLIHKNKLCYLFTKIFGYSKEYSLEVFEKYMDIVSLIH